MRSGLYEGLGASGPLAEVLITLALAHWALVQPREALATAERAVQVLEPGGDSRQHAYALAYLARPADQRRPRRTRRRGPSAAALAMARRLDAPDLVALGQIAHGNARHKQSATPSAVDELCAGIDAAAALSAHVFVMTGYVMLVENLWQMGLLAETERRIAEATAYAEERDLVIYLDPIRAYGFRLQAVARRVGGRRGRAARAAVHRTRAVGSATACPSCPGCSCAAAPTTRTAVLDRAVDFTRRADARYQLTPALMARIELAWLTGRAGRRPATPRRCWPRGPRFRERSGRGPTSCAGCAGSASRRNAFAGCPPEYAAGLRRRLAGGGVRLRRARCAVRAGPGARRLR